MSGGDASKNLTAKGAKAPPPRLKFWPSTDSSPSQKAGVAAAVRRGIGMGARPQEASMITAYHSTVLDYPVDRVWSRIRDFNNYPAYIDGVTASVIEDNKRGDEVGAVRRFKYGDNWIRQRLSEHSDTQRTLTYRGIELFAFPAGRMDDPPAPIRYEAMRASSSATRTPRLSNVWMAFPMILATFSQRTSQKDKSNLSMSEAGITPPPQSPSAAARRRYPTRTPRPA